MKKKLYNIITVLFFSVVITSCGGSDGDGGDGGVAPTPDTPNTAPSAVSQLIYPTSDLLCIDSTVNFEWAAATDPDGDTVSYELRVALDNNMTNLVEQVTSTTTTRTLTLQPGTAYYWTVTAKDAEDSASPSQVFAFYTEGEGVSNYAPFLADLVSPNEEDAVVSGTTSLNWSGADVDINDTLTYDVYFGTSNPPTTAVSTDLTVENFDVSTDPATTYYWQIDTKDNSGTKTIGAVWTFTTN